MNRTTLHPIEVLALAAMALVWAVLNLAGTFAEAGKPPANSNNIRVSDHGQGTSAAYLAARLVLVPVVALVLTLAGWRPTAPQPPTTTPPPAPAEHPLARLAEQLEALPAVTLRSLAGTRSKRHRKAELIAMVAACV